MWKVVIKQGYDDIEFCFKKLDHLKGFIEAAAESVVPDKDGNTAVFVVTYEEGNGEGKEIKENDTV